MEKPLIVGVLGNRAAASALRRLDCETLWLPTAKRIPNTTFAKPPQLFLIRVTATESDSVLAVLGVLQSEWPLTDVLLWAPAASGAEVRAFFRAGAKDVITDAEVAGLVQQVQHTLQSQQLLPRVNDLSRQRLRTGRFESMLSRNEAMWDLFDLCNRVATADATVLIVGETGTGKELLARAIHRRSRRSGRFVAANCASIPTELINSELMGHEKGAFTGANRSKKGLVRHADDGTLFLDEIGDMPAEAQLSLLRVIQEKQVRPVGSLVEEPVNVRIVAATNVLLDEAVRDGNFREDLFYRLDVIRMNVPALRERPEDVLFLLGHFVKRLAKHYGLEAPVFTDQFLDALLRYDWPGNIRELENFSERLVLGRPQHALTENDFERLCTSSLPSERTVQTKTRRDRTGTIDIGMPLQQHVASATQQLEIAYLRELLERYHGRIAESAEHAGISRRTLLRKMNAYGLEKCDFKNPT